VCVGTRDIILKELSIHYSGWHRILDINFSIDTHTLHCISFTSW